MNDDLLYRNGNGEITSVVNPAWVSAPYRVDYLVAPRGLGRRTWSRKRRLKALRRWRRRQERENKLMKLVTAALVDKADKIQHRILGMMLSSGPYLFLPRPFKVEPIIRAVLPASGIPRLFLDLL